MDSVGALLDNADDFREAHLAGVVDLECASSRKADVIDREDDGFKDRLVGFVEWAVDEDVPAAQSCWHFLFSFQALSYGRGHSPLNGSSPELALCGG